MLPFLQGSNYYDEQYLISFGKRREREEGEDIRKEGTEEREVGGGRRGEK